MIVSNCRGQFAVIVCSVEAMIEFSGTTTSTRVSFVVMHSTLFCDYGIVDQLSTDLAADMSNTNWHRGFLWEETDRRWFIAYARPEGLKIYR